MQKKYALSDVSEMMTEGFREGRTPRSLQYQYGTRVILGNRLLGEQIPAPPYPVGSCEADAYFAGQDEGRAIFARLREQEAERDRNRA